MTKRVHVLDPIVAERIAAGEVIERPASVIKELVENSLDAGATEVSVRLEDGGKDLMEVMDNGSGIDGDDLGICVLRHATSKIRSLEDLEKLHTLGFRGEALPSVAAVSELTILSRAKAAPGAPQRDAYQLGPVHPTARDLKPEAVTFGHFLGSPHGTRIHARGLFSQIPARLKFLKSQASEVSHVREWMERLALAHPQVTFRLQSDERQTLLLRAQTEVERVRAILADGEDYPIITEEARAPGLSVRAHWLQGLSSPQTRKLVQVVNGRAVRDRVLQQALLSPFRQALLPGQFPAVALFVEIEPELIDVNVHPSKTELRFLDSRTAFRTIESLVQSMVGRHGAPAFVSGAAGGAGYGGESTASFGAADRAFALSGGPAGEAARPAWSAGWRPQQHQPTFDLGAWRALDPAALPLATASSGATTTADSATSIDSATDAAVTVAPAPVAHPFAHGRLAGTLFNTYILYDLGEELVLVDQHAADERVRYERLRRRVLEGDTQSAQQSLLIPESVTYPAELRPRMEDRLPWLEKLGFEVEVFGEDAVVFRSVPPEWGGHDIRLRLKGLVERTLAAEASDGLLIDERLFEKLASEACHSAVRAGDWLENVEAEALVRSLFACAHPWNCPHGRPTVVRMPRARLEEWFQRRAPKSDGLQL